VASAEVHTAVERRLKHERHLQEADAKDLLQLTLAKLLTSATRPENADGYPRLAWKVAGNVAFDSRRAFAIRGKYNAGPTDLADDYSDDPDTEAHPDHALDIERRKALWQRLIDDGVVNAMDDRVVRLRLEGHDTEEIARILGQQTQSVRNRFARLLKKIGPALAEHQAIVIGGAALTLVALAVFFIWRQKVEEAHLHEHDIRPLRDFHEESRPAVEADHLRHDAFHQCDLRNWDACEKALDAAQALDPTSDARVDVQHARDRIADERALLLPPDPVPAKPGR
jgi:DNA-directed RNA polymerase specialized sigma24 family protein